MWKKERKNYTGGGGSFYVLFEKTFKNPSKPIFCFKFFRLHGLSRQMRHLWPPQNNWLPSQLAFWSNFHQFNWLVSQLERLIFD